MEVEMYDPQDVAIGAKGMILHKYGKPCDVRVYADGFAYVIEVRMAEPLTEEERDFIQSTVPEGYRLEVIQ